MSVGLTSTNLMRGRLSARPSLTLVVLPSPGGPTLEQVMPLLVPPCREYGAELLALGWHPGPKGWDEEWVRFLPAGPGETPLDQRARALGEASGDIVLFLTTEEASRQDVSELLGHRAGIVSLDLAPTDEAASAGQSVG
jgi:hypothetical protein